MKFSISFTSFSSYAILIHTTLGLRLVFVPDSRPIRMPVQPKTLRLVHLIRKNRNCGYFERKPAFEFLSGCEAGSPASFTYLFISYFYLFIGSKRVDGRFSFYVRSSFYFVLRFSFCYF